MPPILILHIFFLFESRFIILSLSSTILDDGVHTIFLAPRSTLLVKYFISHLLYRFLQSIYQLVEAQVHVQIQVQVVIHLDMLVLFSSACECHCTYMYRSIISVEGLYAT